MRILGATLALNSMGACLKADYDHLESKHVSLGLKNEKLDQNFEHYKEKFKVQVGLVEEMIDKNKEIADLT